MITEITAFDPALIEPINRLLAQLSSSHPSISEEHLRQLVESDASHLFLLHEEGEIAGMLTLAIYHAPTGRKAWVEDVVVDNAMRGRALGRKLIDHAIAYARRFSPVALMLTSRPSRVAANALYLSAGFDRRETNVYKMEL